MEQKFRVNNKEYTKAEFGTTITACRLKKGWSQVDVAKKAYKLMNNDDDTGFKSTAERMKLSRIESGKFKPTADYAEALVEVLGINHDDNSTPSDNDLLDYPVELIIKEISVIIERIPQRSAVNLLKIARMIAKGGLSNT